MRCQSHDLTDSVEEGSESTIVNGDEASERLASELGPSCQSLPGTRNVNIESLYEVRSLGLWPIPLTDTDPKVRIPRGSLANTSTPKGAQRKVHELHGRTSFTPESGGRRMASTRRS